MADNTDDPIADIPPDQTPVAPSGPVVTSTNGILLLMFTHILVLIYYRAAWYGVETLVFEKYPAFGQYSIFFMIPYLVPIAGMIASIVNQSTGGLAAWTMACVIIASILMGLSLIYVIVLDLPPPVIEFAMSLFKSASSPPAAVA